MPHLSDDQVALQLAAISEVYPNLIIESVRVETTGQRSNVLVINDALVIRFPRTQAGAQAMAAEIPRAIGERVPLPIPAPRFEHLAIDPFGRSFVGYPRLPGTPLWRETLLSLDVQTQRDLAHQLGSFLYALHTVPLDVLPADPAVQDKREQWVTFYATVRANLFPSMRPESRRAVERHFETYLNAAPNQNAFSPVLRHGDFGPTNILYDPQARAIGGIIDFGSAGLGDSATDIAALMSPVSYGEAFVELLAPIYRGLEALVGRARFYVGTFALQEALWGFEHGDQNALLHGVAPYV